MQINFYTVPPTGAAGTTVLGYKGCNLYVILDQPDAVLDYLIWMGVQLENTTWLWLPHPAGNVGGNAGEPNLTRLKYTSTNQGRLIDRRDFNVDSASDPWPTRLGRIYLQQISISAGAAATCYLEPVSFKQY